MSRSETQRQPASSGNGQERDIEIRQSFREGWNGERFIPENVIKELTTPDNVRAHLETDRKHRFQDVSITSLVNYITDKDKPARKVFLALVFCDKLKYLVSLRGGSFRDKHLPIQVTYEDGRPSIRTLNMDGKNSPPIEVFESWKVAHVESFIHQQWHFMAPIFIAQRLKYHIDRRCPLPFRRKSSSNNGYGGSVSEIEVPDGHIRGEFSDKRIALKIVHADKKKYFDREAASLRVMRKLKHNHLIYPLAAIQRGNDLGFLLPWAEGGNLEEFWKKYRCPRTEGNPSLKWILTQLYGLCKATEALHGENCRYTDLKPQNILLFLEGEKPGTLRIADVGLARIHEDATPQRQAKTNVKTGTLRYEAPELGNDKLSRVFDVWSLGCVFLEFLIWTIHGWNPLHAFTTKSEQFWDSIRDKPYRAEPISRKIREMLMDIQRFDPKSVTWWKEFLVVVDQRMLVADSNRRATIAEVCRKLEAIRDNYITNDGNTQKTDHSITTNVDHDDSVRSITLEVDHDDSILSINCEVNNSHAARSIVPEADNNDGTRSTIPAVDHRDGSSSITPGVGHSDGAGTIFPEVDLYDGNLLIAPEIEHNDSARFVISQVDNDDAASDFSLESVFSETSSASTSASSQSSVEGESDLSDELALFLLRNEEIQTFFNKTRQLHDETRFIEQFHRILMRYLIEIRKSTRIHLYSNILRAFVILERAKKVTKSALFWFHENRERDDEESVDQEDEEGDNRGGKEGGDEEEEQADGKDQHEARQARLQDRLGNAQIRYSENEIRPQEMDEVGATEQLRQFRMVEDYISSGQPFQSFKARLEYLTNRPESLTEALVTGSSGIVSIFLEQRFNDVATGEYEWLQDLKDMGYSEIEMADLLYEKFHDSPWIYFDSLASRSLVDSTSAPAMDHHLEGCAHRPLLDDPIFSLFPEKGFTLSDETEIKRQIEELCGLCGISPDSRESSLWNGSIEFETWDNGLCATISSSLPQDQETMVVSSEVVPRLLEAIKGIQAAAGLMQAASFCCQSFTILVAKNSNPQHSRPQISLQCFNFSIINDITEMLQKLRRDGDLQVLSDLRALSRVVLNVFLPAIDGFEFSETAEEFYSSMQLISLAIQVLGIGLLSYSQAHIGEMRPFFLDTPLRRIELVGLRGPSSMSEKRSEGITVQLERLTCLDGMVGEKVMVFRPSATSPPSETRFDVHAKLEDVLDTWGPGQILFQKQKPNLPVAVRIGNGFISPSSEDDKSDKFHWGHNVTLSDKYHGLNLQRNIIIGTLIEANSHCTNKMTECWKNSRHLIQPVGTHDSYLETAAHEMQFQGGAQGLVAGYVNVKEKRPRITVKDKYFRPPGCPSDSGLVQHLDEYWAVRVSCCTLVAQRVRLRQMIGDLFPTFAKTYYRKKHQQTWHKLQGNLVQEFNGRNATLQSLINWLGDLDEPSYAFVLLVSKAIINTLVDTGLSPNGGFFQVAWPYEHETYKGIRVPVDETTTKWLPILEDSKDSATFAYITNVCLETQGAPCRGSISALTDRVLLLETAVSCHTREPPPLWTLCHEKLYYFERADNIAHFAYWVRVEKDVNAADKPTTLVRVHALERMKPAFAFRLIEKLRGEEPKIRETGYSIGKAETVRILSRELF